MAKSIFQVEPRDQILSSHLEELSNLLCRPLTSDQLRKAICLRIQAKRPDLCIEEIADLVGMDKKEIYKLNRNFLERGCRIFDPTTPEPRRRLRLSHNEELQILDQLRVAPRVNRVDPKELKAALENRLGFAIALSTAYLTLKRHRWEGLGRYSYWKNGQAQ